MTEPVIHLIRRYPNREAFNECQDPAHAKCDESWTQLDSGSYEQECPTCHKRRAFFVYKVITGPTSHANTLSHAPSNWREGWK